MASSARSISYRYQHSSHAASHVHEAGAVGHRPHRHDREAERPGDSGQGSRVLGGVERLDRGADLVLGARRDRAHVARLAHARELPSARRRRPALTRLPPPPRARAAARRHGRRSFPRRRSLPSSERRRSDEALRPSYVGHRPFANPALLPARAVHSSHTARWLPPSRYGYARSPRSNVRPHTSHEVRASAEDARMSLWSRRARVADRRGTSCTPRCGADRKLVQKDVGDSARGVQEVSPVKPTIGPSYAFTSSFSARASSTTLEARWPGTSS